jgi:hypothetical protein
MTGLFDFVAFPALIRIYGTWGNGGNGRFGISALRFPSLLAAQIQKPTVDATPTATKIQKERIFGPFWRVPVEEFISPYPFSNMYTSA